MFIASPLKVDQAELIKLSKRLKKEKVNVDIINFGEEEANNGILNEFINTLNGKEGTSSHLVSIAAPASLSDALFSSSMFQDEDGNSLPAGFGPGFQFGMEDDPELAMVNSPVIGILIYKKNLKLLNYLGIAYFNGRKSIETRSRREKGCWKNGHGRGTM